MFQGLRNSAHGVAEEFKKFVMRGNVVDLAVGIIIGTAFKGITTSLVKDVVTPPIGQLTGGLDFSHWVIPLDLLNFGREAAEVATINIGNFVNVVIDFLITAIAIFFLIKVVNKLDEAVDEIGDLLDGDEEEAAPEPEPEPEPEPQPEPEPEPTTDEKILEVLERISAQLDERSNVSGRNIAQ